MKLGWTEILLIALLILILFGPKRLPELARSLGKSLFEFKKGMREATEDIKNADEKANSNSNGTKQE